MSRLRGRTGGGIAARVRRIVERFRGAPSIAIGNVPAAPSDKAWRDDDHREGGKSEPKAVDPWHIPTGEIANTPNPTRLPQWSNESSAEHTPPLALEPTVSAPQRAIRKGPSPGQQLGLALVPADDLFAKLPEASSKPSADTTRTNLASNSAETTGAAASGSARPDEALPFPATGIGEEPTSTAAVESTETFSPDEWDALKSAEIDDVSAQSARTTEREPSWSLINPDNLVPELESDSEPEVEQSGEESDEAPPEVTTLDPLLDESWGEIDSAEATSDAVDENFVGIERSRDGDAGLFDFDESAQQPLWELPDDEEIAKARPREKAAAIASLVDITSRQEETHLLAWLTELFTHLKYPATYAALKRAAERGLTFDTLKAMALLRQCWMDHPEWWVRRRGFRHEVRALPHGPASLTWVLARAVCEARSEFPPDAMIDGDWLDEWYTLPVGAAGYYSFPEFVAQKVSSLDAEFLDSALAEFERRNEGFEFGDDRRKYRQSPNMDEAVKTHLLSFNPLARRENELSVGQIVDDKNEGDRDD